MTRKTKLAVVFLCGTAIGASQEVREPHAFFRDQVGLSDSEIAMIARGKAVAKVLPTRMPAEILIFGAVFVNANPERYAKLALDMGRLRRSPNYLGAGRFSDPPVLSDLEGFTLEPEDIRSLRTCRPGKCGVQLPAQAIEDLREALDWSRPDVGAQVNTRIRRMALEVVRRYQEDGNRVLGDYRDAGQGFDVGMQLRSLVGQTAAPLAYLPELNHYLLEYPRIRPATAESLFYWERVHFGMKPTLRLNHAIAYRSTGAREPARIVIVKQLYASHYFQIALDVTACVTGIGAASNEGFYLISLKGSSQQGLTGFMGSLLRRIIVGRARSAQERLLIHTKDALEDRHSRMQDLRGPDHLGDVTQKTGRFEIPLQIRSSAPSAPGRHFAGGPSGSTLAGIGAPRATVTVRGGLPAGTGRHSTALPVKAGGNRSRAKYGHWLPAAGRPDRFAVPGTGWFQVDQRCGRVAARMPLGVSRKRACRFGTQKKEDRACLLQFNCTNWEKHGRRHVRGLLTKRRGNSGWQRAESKTSGVRARA